MKPSRSQLTVAALCAALFLAVVGTFFPALHNGFVNFDDPDYLTANREVQSGVTWAGIQWALRTNTAANWHPLTWLSHMLDCQLFGLEPRGHHLTSVVLHALSTVLVFLVFQRMTGARWRSLFVAALFGLHPLRVESVAWVAERKDVLAALFWMLTLWCYAVWVGCRSARGAWLFYALALLCFALGLMSKPMLVTLPCVLLLLDYWPLARWSEPRRFPGPLFVEKLPFLLLAAGASVVTALVQGHAGAVKTIASFPLAARLGNAVVSYVRYLGKFFCPTDLAAFYPHPVFWPWWQVIAATTFLLFATALALRWGRTLPYLAVGWFWYLGTAVPVIGLVQVGAQSMADRYTYLPLLGIALIVAWGAADLLRTGRWRAPALAGSAEAALVTCIFLTWRQLPVWRDGESLFRQAVAVTGKNPVAQMNLGLALWDKGAHDAAFEHLFTAQALAPGYGEAHLNLGAALEKSGRLDAAYPELLKAIELLPRSAPARLSLGNVLQKAGRPEEAIRLYEEALRLQPDFAEAHNNLGVALKNAGRGTEAAEHYRKALELKPAYADAHLNLGETFYQLDRLEEAQAHFEEALKLRPNWADAHNDLAGTFFLGGRLDDAIAEYEEALRLDPSHAGTRANLDAVRQIQRSQTKP